MSLIPAIKGGLGNQLFEVASIWSIAKSLRRPFKLDPRYIHKSGHSDENYFDTIMLYWKPYLSEQNITRVVQEDSHLKPQDFIKMIGGNKKETILMNGYFQTAKYMDPYYNEVISHFNWNKSAVQSYDELSTSAFIHVRGGDYLPPGLVEGSHLHYINMTNYYKNALEKIKDSVKHFYVFTNDQAYLESQQFFDDIRYSVIPSNVSEVDSLYLMSQCKQGGIGVNSSFSWWGLYLDKHRPHLMLPDRWYTNPAFFIDGYYFNGIQKIGTV